MVSNVITPGKTFETKKQFYSGQTKKLSYMCTSFHFTEKSKDTFQSVIIEHPVSQILSQVSINI